MIIFNNTDHPILVRMGERELLIEANRFIEEAIEEGVYPLTVYKQKDNGKPLTFRHEKDEDWGMFARRGIVSLAVSRKIEVERNTKFHIVEQEHRYRFYGYGNNTRYLELLDCTVESGALSELCSVFASPAQRRYLVQNLHLMLGLTIFFHTMISLIPLAEWNDPDAWWLISIFQILFIFEEWQCIRSLRILRQYPVVSEKGNNDRQH